MNEFTIKIQAPELAKAILALANAFSGQSVKVPNVAKITEVKEEKVTKELVKEEKSEVKKSEVKEEAEKFTEVEVRAKFVELAQKGKRAELKKMLDDFGVAKVSELKEDQYEEAMQQLGEM